jgi:hypothetical protein
MHIGRMNTTSEDGMQHNLRRPVPYLEREGRLRHGFGSEQDGAAHTSDFGFSILGEAEKGGDRVVRNSWFDGEGVFTWTKWKHTPSPFGTLLPKKEKVMQIGRSARPKGLGELRFYSYDHIIWFQKSLRQLRAASMLMRPGPFRQAAGPHG